MKSLFPTLVCLLLLWFMLSFGLFGRFRYFACRGGLSRSILSPLCGFSTRFLRALVDTTLCFTRSEGARARERESEREGGSAPYKMCDVTNQGCLKVRCFCFFTSGTTICLFIQINCHIIYTHIILLLSSYFVLLIVFVNLCRSITTMHSSETQCRRFHRP